MMMTIVQNLFTFFKFGIIINFVSYLYQATAKQPEVSDIWKNLCVSDPHYVLLSKIKKE